ncbi:hypothetical protein [Bradyrhizobium sp. Gha]|uniref:hypothetical protein n=1 Tax=Bradyrhizobium sp. Gha TaxID=1855318 RepID=UPI000B8425C6|nr:hypothetical protein [Bradyrhizobium sp. Gha]
MSTGATLTAGHKLALISVLTREVIEVTNADALVRVKLAEDLSLGLETLMLDDVAASTTRPAGLRNGVNKTTATAGGSLNAMLTDLSTLAGKVAAVGGGDVVFIADATTVTKVKILAPLFPYPIWASGGVADGTVIAIAPRALCISGSSDAPRISVSNEAVLHMEDAVPLPISTASSMPFPVKSLYQTDCAAVRIICSDVAWGWRGAGCAYTDSISW